MKEENVDKLSLGLYKIFWKNKEGGGSSLAAVGQDSLGRLWFAPINWLTVPSRNWKLVKNVKRIR